MALTFGEKLLKYPTAVGRIAIVIINNVYCIPTYVVWMAMLIPLKRIKPQIYYKIEGLFFHWLLAVVSMWSYTAGYDIVEVGDDINECINKRTLVIANHQSTADVPLLMAGFNTKENVLPNLMWIMDRLFKYTNFGIVSIIHQDFFISAGRKNREESVNALRKHIKTSFLKLDRKWMVLFPEGGFLRKRRAASQRFAEKNNLPVLEHITLPRVGAFKAIIESMCVRSSNNDDKQENNDDNNINNIDNDHTTNNTNNSSTKIKTTNLIDHINSNINNLNNDNDMKKMKISNVITTEATDTVKNSSDNLRNNSISDNKSNSLASDQLSNIKSTDTDTNPKLSNGNLIADKLKEIEKSIFSSSDCLLEYVLDITIAYPNGIPLDLPNILHGWRDPCKVHFLYRLYKVSEIPKDERALTQWLYDRFIEKNDLLQNFYNCGQFYPNRMMCKNLIQQDVLRFVLINLFFITSTYLHYQLFCVIHSYYNILIYSISS